VFKRFPKLTKVYVNKKTNQVSVTRKSGFEILYKKDFMAKERDNNKSIKPLKKD